MVHETPTFTYAIKKSIDYEISKINTCLPGVVVKYNPKKQLAEVKPGVDFKLTSGRLVELPIIIDVPIVFPRAGGGGISFPIEKGDKVILLFCQRSIEEFFNKGDAASTDSERKFSLTDAMAIPGIVTGKESSFSPAGNRAEMVFRDFKISISRNGRIAIGKGNIELLDLFHRFISNFTGTTPITINSVTGSMDLPTPVIIAQAKSIISLLNQIKGSL